MNRRHLLQAPAAALAAGLFKPQEAAAAAPFAMTQPPAFHRMTLGGFQVTALLDGTVPLPLSAMYNNTTPAQVDQALAAAFLRSPVELSVNAYLVNTGDRLVLIDAGAAGLLGPRLGKLPGVLRAAGYAPEQVDAVLLTHIHTDHSGGLVVDGQVTFPNATVHANRRDAEYWLDPANLARAPVAKQALFREAVACISPYEATGRFHTFNDNAAPIPGFRSIWRPGHTPGHSSIVVESGGETLIAWGDVTHGDVVQFDEPGIGIEFDVDSRAAAVTRRTAFAEAAAQRIWIAGAHIAFPGIGHVRADSASYDWVPINYSSGGES